MAILAGIFLTTGHRSLSSFFEETMRIGKFATMTLAVLALMAPHVTRTQNDDAAAKNAAQARAALDAMVQALGGQAWLNMKNMERQGHIAAFYQGNPDPGTTEYFEFHQWPDHDRIELTKHRDVVEFYVGRQGWEVTYRGKKPLDKDIVDDYLRRRDHSIETAVKVWMKDPNTILIYEGQHLAERHLAEQVTLISPAKRGHHHPHGRADASAARSAASSGATRCTTTRTPTPKSTTTITRLTASPPRSPLRGSRTANPTASTSFRT